MLPSTLSIMWPMHLQSLKLLCLTVYEEMHLQENTLFDLDHGLLITFYNSLDPDQAQQTIWPGLDPFQTVWHSDGIS